MGRSTSRPARLSSHVPCHAARAAPPASGSPNAHSPRPASTTPTLQHTPSIPGCDAGSCMRRRPLVARRPRAHLAMTWPCSARRGTSPVHAADTEATHATYWCVHACGDVHTGHCGDCCGAKSRAWLLPTARAQVPLEQGPAHALTCICRLLHSAHTHLWSSVRPRRCGAPSSDSLSALVAQHSTAGAAP
jgi:hypothetical protein